MAKKNTLLNCCKCEKDKFVEDFYNFNSFTNKDGFLMVCKRCIKEIYEGLFDIYNDCFFSLIHLCVVLNIPFDLTLAKKTMDINTPSESVLIYFNSLSKKVGKKEVDCINKDSINDIMKYNRENNLENLDLESYMKDFKITSDIIVRWGDTYDKKELYFLEKEYKTLIDYYGIGSPTQLQLFKDYAIGNLKMTQCLNIGDDDGYMKYRKAQSTLLKDAGLKPKEKEEINEDELLVGLIAKKIEETKPIALKDSKYNDVDDIGKIIKEEYVNQLGRCIGKI